MMPRENSGAIFFCPKGEGYYTSAIGMPLQAATSLSKHLSRQCLILKWTTKA